MNPRGFHPDSLWRNADFMKLWGGETVSQIGTQITVLALPLTAVISLRAGVEQLGVLTAAQFLPVMAITLFVGVWLDTHRHRPILVAANFGRAVLLGTIPLLFALHALTIGALYAVAFLAGLLTAVFDVTYLVYLPWLTTPDKLVEANAKLESTYSVAQIAGPGLGGVLVQAISGPGAILVDAVTYLLAGCGVVAIRHREPAHPPGGPTASVWTGIRLGLAETFKHRLIRPLVTQAAWFNMFEAVVLTLYPLYGVRVLHLPPGLLGALLAMSGVGAVAGASLAQRAGRAFGIGPTILIAVLTASAALSLVPAAHGPKPVAASMLLVGMALYGLGMATFNVHYLALRARVLPPDLLGRVTATCRFISYAPIPLGGLLAGFLGGALGIRWAMVVAVVLLVAKAGALATSPVRHITETQLRVAA